MAADPAPDRPAPPSALAPLARPVFRALWLAALVSNVGFWMQSVGAVWQVGTVSGSAALVALPPAAPSGAWPRDAWASGRPCWPRRPASAWGWWRRRAGGSRGSVPST